MSRAISGKWKSFVLLIGAAVVFANSSPAVAQPVDGLQIDWEVANRFRLFATQKEFDRHLRAFREATTKTTLGSEQWLARESRGFGWADTVDTLCFDNFRGRILERCVRDGYEETYLNSLNERIKLFAKLPDGFGEATCEWTIGEGNAAKTLPARPCGEVVDSERASTRAPTSVKMIARNQDGRTLEANIDIKVRDIFIVGLGDSIASGEGNPIHPVALNHEAFCFRRVLAFLLTEDFFLPGRSGITVNSSCQTTENDANDREAWDTASAGWLYSPCHRSLYSYQLRTALALALENRKISVTFLPLGCSGAEIGEGLFNSMPARERPKDGNRTTPSDVEAQLSQLRNYLRSITANGQRRPVDLILLTVGANDMGFSGIVADIIINSKRERDVLKSQIVTLDKAADRLQAMRKNFQDLRDALRQIIGNDSKRVVFTTYGNPGLHDGGKPCATTRRGFDAHPAFTANGDKLAKAVKFVETNFIKKLKDYVQCAPGTGCNAARFGAMTYVDGHREAFASHGFCAAADNDPEFDKKCFKDGGSFRIPSTMESPLTCAEFFAPSFRPYAQRARWIRTANDSYFAAMSYPSAAGFLNNPSDIHDARWGLTSVVYGGALHPTAEGHAAMADAALAAARRVLDLPAPETAAPSQ